MDMMVPEGLAILDRAALPMMDLVVQPIEVQVVHATLDQAALPMVGLAGPLTAVQEVQCQGRQAALPMMDLVVQPIEVQVVHATLDQAAPAILDRVAMAGVVLQYADKPPVPIPPGVLSMSRLLDGTRTELRCPSNQGLTVRLQVAAF